MTEQFRTVTTDNRYLISSRGRVWSKRARKYLKPFARGNSGHLAVALPDGTIYVHQLVALAFHGPPSPGHEVRHLNNMGNDNRAENLKWGTRSENVLDLRAKKSHCPHGHEYTPKNSIFTKRGHRRCRECKKRYRNTKVER